MTDAAKLALDRVTLCCVDCVNHDLALAALDQCARKCDFARVLFVTDRELAIAGVDIVRIAPIRSREAYSQFVIKELAAHVTSDFVLLVQWDGFVVNAAAWRDDFLDYDYIGAKWIFHTDGHNVGNGGFSLRSRRLLAALRDPHVTADPAEDVAICRTFRPYLEAAHGIRFAPEAVADRFSFEASYFDELPFGFHGLFNFWMFLGRTELAAFLAMVTPAILGSVQCLQLARNYADLGRNEEATMLLRRIVGAHPAAGEAAALLALVEGGTPPPPAALSRNAPCPCGSGKRFKECHGRLESRR
jgi:hypothetical protein